MKMEWAFQGTLILRFGKKNLKGTKFREIFKVGVSIGTTDFNFHNNSVNYTEQNNIITKRNKQKTV